MTTVVSASSSERSPKRCRGRRASSDYSVVPASSDAEDASLSATGEPSKKRKRSLSCSTNSSSISTKRHHKKKKKKMKHKDREQCGPRVNPIFLWVKQDDTKIVEVLCEDYDRRNRITLTKTAGGWRSIPHSDHLSRRCSSIIANRSQSSETDVDEHPCFDVDHSSDVENTSIVKADSAEETCVDPSEKDAKAKESPRKVTSLDIYDFHEDSDDDPSATKTCEDDSVLGSCCQIDVGLTDENHNSEYHEPIVDSLKEKSSPAVVRASSPECNEIVDSQSQVDTTELVDLIDELHDGQNMRHGIEDIKNSCTDGQSLKEISLGVCSEVLKDVEKDDEFSSDSVPFIDNNACSDLIDDLCHEIIDERLNEKVNCGDFCNYIGNTNEVYGDAEDKLLVCAGMNSIRPLHCSQSTNTNDVHGVHDALDKNGMSIDGHDHDLLRPDHSLMMEHSHQPSEAEKKQNDLVSLECLSSQTDHTGYGETNPNYEASESMVVSDKVHVPESVQSSANYELQIPHLPDSSFLHTSSLQLNSRDNLLDRNEQDDVRCKPVNISTSLTTPRPSIDLHTCSNDHKRDELRDFHINSSGRDFESTLNKYLQCDEEKSISLNQSLHSDGSFMHHDTFYDGNHGDEILPEIHLSYEKVNSSNELKSSEHFIEKNTKKHSLQLSSDKTDVDVTKEKKLSCNNSEHFEVTGSPINLVVNKSLSETFKKEKSSPFDHLTDISVTALIQSETSKKSNNITITDSHKMTTEDRKRYLDKVLNISHAGQEKPPEELHRSIVQKEPLNLGKVKKEKSLSPLVLVSKGNVKSEARTSKSKTDHVDSMSLTVVPDHKTRDTKKELKETSKLLELLSPEGKDPLAQLKEILSDPNIVVPDPLLVPRGRLAALVANPAKEIPRLLVHSQHESDLVVVSISHLQTMLQSYGPTVKPPSYATPPLPFHHNKSPIPQTSVPNKLHSMDPSHIFWLPYLGQLEAALAYGATTQDFLSTLNALGQYPQTSYKAGQKATNFVSPTLPQDQHHMFNIWQDIMQKPDMGIGWKGATSKPYMQSSYPGLSGKQTSASAASTKMASKHTSYHGSAGSSARTTPNLAGYHRPGRTLPEAIHRAPEAPRPQQPAKLKVKDHLVDPNIRPQLLKLDDSPHPLWHPLFSSQQSGTRSYPSPWNWTTPVTVNAD